MLILGRSKNRSIIIGEGDDTIEITVLAIEPNHVRLGFTTKKNISIHREEIYQKIHGSLPEPRPDLKL